MDENKNKVNESAASETFDTWTLVTENQTLQNSGADTDSNLNDNVKRIEILNKDENLKAPEVNVEELSDGISVISESESIEECNERYSLSHDALYGSQVEHSLTASNIEYNNRNQIVSTKDNESQKQITNYLTVSNIASSIFYVGMVAAMLGFAGQLKNINDGSAILEISSLKDRIDGLENNNNLLRAEIDILQKKVTFLTNQYQAGSNFNNKYQKNQEHQYRAENILNDKVENIKINEKPNVIQAPKKPDITSACEDNEKYVNGVCAVVEEKTSSKFEKPENVEKFEQEPKNRENNFNKEFKPNKDFKSNFNQNEYKHHNHKPVDYKISGKNVDQFSAESNEDDDDLDDDNSYEEKNFKRDKSDEFYKKSKHYNENKKDRFNSKEYKYDKSKEGKYDKKKNDADWHHKLMDSREDFRKQKAKGKDNNWYIERGHSREEFRIFDDNDYEKGKGH